MKNLFFTATLLLAILGKINAEDLEQPKQTSEKQKVEINHKMIEKFKRAEFPENAISFNDLMTNYTITEVKLIVAAYQANDFTFESKDLLNEKLAELKQQVDEGEIKESPIQNLLTLTDEP